MRAGILHACIHLDNGIHVPFLHFCLIFIVQKSNESYLQQASCSFVVIGMTSMSVSHHSIQEKFLQATANAATHPLLAQKTIANC